MTEHQTVLTEAEHKQAKEEATARIGEAFDFASSAVEWLKSAEYWCRKSGDFDKAKRIKACHQEQIKVMVKLLEELTGQSLEGLTDEALEELREQAVTS